jgi:hypothetical protein
VAQHESSDSRQQPFTPTLQAFYKRLKPRPGIGEILAAAKIPSQLAAAGNLSIDAQGPVVTLNIPANNTASTSGTVSFSYTPAENNSIANCSLLNSGQVRV